MPLNSNFAYNADSLIAVIDAANTDKIITFNQAQCYVKIAALSDQGKIDFINKVKNVGLEAHCAMSLSDHNKSLSLKYGLFSYRKYSTNVVDYSATLIFQFNDETTDELEFKIASLAQNLPNNPSEERSFKEQGGKVEHGCQCAIM